ncbi:hypothetical protein LEP1GSC158_0139 [Leptospira interrogans serovar Zanoni str. LT2156]|uniref:Uncharacterized protein n=1 Tax=Leptospira interrogans serovar Zanoni str. LT2156 TaxID=1001601 RepID=M6HFE8_LEPIR|nr:hypothetical protein LEP1GSC158_0139 [Leptospira interrogans serovar Zanoni str. LT2156]
MITELILIYGFYSKNPIHFKQFFFVLNIKKPGKQNRAAFMSFDSLTESFNLKTSIKSNNNYVWRRIPT